MKQVGNTILAKGGNHILAKRDNSAWPKGSKLSGFSTFVNNYEILTIIHKTDDDFDVNDFWNKMNDFKLREIINTETRDIKTILYAKAFGEFDNLDENDFD